MPEPAPAVETFTAAELLKMDLPEPKWAVERLLPEGLNLLASKPKLCKSWMALNIGLAIAIEGTALSKIDVEGGDVLYLALEDTKRRLKKRIKKLLPEETGPVRDKMTLGRLTLARVWPRQDKGGLAAIAEWLEAHPEARLVVIDTWQKFRPPKIGRGNEYEQDYQHAAEVKALADLYGVAILVIHHTRKGGAEDPLEEVSGTLGLTGCADTGGAPCPGTARPTAARSG